MVVVVAAVVVVVVGGVNQPLHVLGCRCASTCTAPVIKRTTFATRRKDFTTSRRSKKNRLSDVTVECVYATRYSNVGYLATGLVVMAMQHDGQGGGGPTATEARSAAAAAFALPDYWFGVSVVVRVMSTAPLRTMGKQHHPPWEKHLNHRCEIFQVLSVASFLWHASNAPWVHHVDIAVMEAGIAYLQLRAATLITRYWLGLSLATTASACLVVFAAYVSCNCYSHYLLARRQGFDGYVPSGHHRCEAGRADLGLVETCFFWALPVLYVAAATTPPPLRAMGIKQRLCAV